ncbi:MAG: formate dehydrogenase accessory sulfurtransferase FdhD [Gemmatimonadaceae bacterium]
MAIPGTLGDSMPTTVPPVHPLTMSRLGYASPLLQYDVVHWTADGGAEAPSAEAIAEEVPVTLVYNNAPHAVMMATPADLEDFALGFSITEGLISTPAQLEHVRVVRYGQGIELQCTVPVACASDIGSRTRRLSGRTGCGICGADSVKSVLREVPPVPDGVPLPAAMIHTALASLATHQTLNAAARAVHAAGWAHADGRVTLAREDVGRHNALDKLVGAVLAAAIDVTAGFAVTTSRGSFEMVQKAAILGAPLLATISAPTALAVRVAHQVGLTLVGFARGGQHIVYTHPWRVSD